MNKESILKIIDECIIYNENLTENHIKSLEKLKLDILTLEKRKKEKIA